MCANPTPSVFGRVDHGWGTPWIQPWLAMKRMWRGATHEKKRAPWKGVWYRPWVHGVYHGTFNVMTFTYSVVHHGARHSLCIACFLYLTTHASVDISSIMGQPTTTKMLSSLVNAMITHGAFHGKCHDISHGWSHGTCTMAHSVKRNHPYCMTDGVCHGVCLFMVTIIGHPMDGCDMSEAYTSV